MSEFYDSDGNPVEAFSKEEIDSKIEEGLKTSKEESIKELDILKTEKAELEEKLKGHTEGDGKAIDDKDMNFNNVRTLLKEKDKQIGDLSTKLQEFVDGIDVKLNTKKIEDSIAVLAGGDTELTKKIRYHFNNYKLKMEDEDPTKKEENFKTRLGYAYSLATGKDPEVVLNGSVVSFGGGVSSAPPTKLGKISEESAEVGKKLNLSEDEMKKGGLI